MSNIKITEEPLKAKPHMTAPCFFEWNKLGCKIHIAFDGDRIWEAPERIDEGIAILNYGQNAVMIYMEKHLPKKIVNMIKEEKK